MSKPVKVSAIEDFKNICRSEFSYLLTDFGFQEDHSPLGEFEKEFQIRFVRNDLTVVIEGIHYGSAAMVYLQDSRKRRISPIQLKPDFQPSLSKPPKHQLTGQVEEIKNEAYLLKTYGMELLEGNFAAFERAYKKIEMAWTEYEDRRKFGVAEQEAVAAFKSQNWQRVVELLEPHEDKISERMARKLKTAKENLH